MLSEILGGNTVYRFGGTDALFVVGVAYLTSVIGVLRQLSNGVVDVFVLDSPIILYFCHPVKRIIRIFYGKFVAVGTGKKNGFMVWLLGCRYVENSPLYDAPDNRWF